MTHVVDAVFVGDHVSSKIIIDGIYEHRELAFLAKELFSLFPHDSTALDIGANIGNHACFFADHFKRVVAFEPNPMVATLLRLNSSGRRIEVVEKGLSDTNGTLNFSLNRKNLGGSMVTDGNTRMEIEVERLDSLVETMNLQDVSFVKIDVEGHEDEVLAGSFELLSKQRPIIAMGGFYKTDVKRVSVYQGYCVRWGAVVFTLFSNPPKYGTGTVSSIPKLLKRRPLALEPLESLEGRDYGLAIISEKPICSTTQTHIQHLVRQHMNNR